MLDIYTNTINTACKEKHYTILYIQCRTQILQTEKHYAHIKQYTYTINRKKLYTHKHYTQRKMTHIFIHT